MCVCAFEYRICVKYDYVGLIYEMFYLVHFGFIVIKMMSLYIYKRGLTGEQTVRRSGRQVGKQI